MPSLETVERFIARVEENVHDLAIEEFYNAGASMRENQGEPRFGRDALVAHERRVLARAASVESKCIRPVLISGDCVAIRWTFAFVWRDGSRTFMEEVAWQRWDGERIAEETFFYDPAQRVPK